MSSKEMDGAAAGMQVHALPSSSQNHSPHCPQSLKLLELVPFPPGWCWHILPSHSLALLGCHHHHCEVL